MKSQPLPQDLFHAAKTIVCVLLLTQPATSARAQSAPNSASTKPVSSAAGAEEAVQLSPFEVNTTRDFGYIATNTLAGSRLNSNLLTTPARRRPGTLA